MGFHPLIKYRIFGINLLSNYVLTIPASDFIEREDVEFVVDNHSHPITPSQEFIYESPYRDDKGIGYFRLYLRAGNPVLRLSFGIEYEFSGSRILCFSQDPSHPGIESGLLGAVLAFWLETHEITALHASAVEVNGHSLIFLASGMSGKSSLAASFIKLGFPLMCDDIVPIENRDNQLLCSPGFPLMRMWPAEAAFFIGDTRGLSRENPLSEKLLVPIGTGGFGKFSQSSKPIRTLYLPQRNNPLENGESIKILPISPRDAIIEILRFSFTPRMAEAVGYAASRLNQISEIARAIPVKRLIYPSGYQYLEAVRNAVLADSK